MQRPSRVNDAIGNTIFVRALKKALMVISMNQDEIGKWGRVPRSVRMKMSADDVAEWRRQNKNEKP